MAKPIPLPKKLKSSLAETAKRRLDQSARKHADEARKMEEARVRAKEAAEEDAAPELKARRDEQRMRQARSALQALSWIATRANRRFKRY